MLLSIVVWTQSWATTLKLMEGIQRERIGYVGANNSSGGGVGKPQSLWTGVFLPFQERSQDDSAFHQSNLPTIRGLLSLSRLVAKGITP